MRYAVLTTAFSCGFWAVCGIAAEVSGNYGDALRAAKAAGQPLLVVLDKTPRAETITRLAGHAGDKLESELLDSYQLCHIDVTSQYGQRVADAFAANRFPQLAIIDRTASVILYRHTGPMAASQLVATLAAYRSGKRPGASGGQRSRDDANCFT